LGVALLSSIGCAEQSPPKMGVEQHEEAAQAEQRAASAADPCVSGRTPQDAPCWTSHSSEIAEHERAAAEQQHVADLQRAEQQACADVSKEDRVQSPFSHREDILSVQPLVMKPPDGVAREVGAVVVFRKIPNLTAQKLRDIVDCHLARNAALGVDRPDLAYCPLTVNPLAFKNLKVGVTERTDGFALTLETSENREVAHEILLRAQRAAGSARCLTAPAETST
jgi:hypothetical protein